MKNLIQLSLGLIVIALNMVPVLAVQTDPPNQELELPACDIYLFDVVTAENSISIANGRNVTKRAGYDNQPWFTPSGNSFLFTANYQPDRTDVYEFELESGEIQQVTTFKSGGLSGGHSGGHFSRSDLLFSGGWTSCPQGYQSVG